MDEGYIGHIVEHPEISVRDLEVIRAHQPNAHWIVDLASGRGGFIATCQGEPMEVLGLDNNPVAARICRGQGLPFVLGDVASLPFASGSLDVVRAKEIIEHLGDASTMLEEIHRVLRRDGLFLAHVPSQFSTIYPVGNFWDDYTHVRPLSRLGVKRLLEDGGFQLIFIRGYTAGRNAWERLAGRVLSLVLPHTWLAVARKSA